jgi:hypothetical protein
MEKYRVTLVSEERAALEQLISSGRSASRKRVRSQKGATPKGVLVRISGLAEANQRG